jgi:hypothetical protein
MLPAQGVSDIIQLRERSDKQAGLMIVGSKGPLRGRSQKTDAHTVIQSNCYGSELTCTYTSGMQLVAAGRSLYIRDEGTGSEK